ncbi:MAG TPA: Hsp20/alpha crystallin family protein [Candidatus Eisenbacteria bacterium]
MKALIPTNGITALRREMDRIFDQLWETDITSPVLGEWTPVIDVSDKGDVLVVKAEVPGIDPKDITVNLEENVLTFSGEKKYEKEEKDLKHYRMERAMGMFSRSFRLPVPVEPGDVKATFKNGLLTVQLPKAKVGKGATIPVKIE